MDDEKKITIEFSGNGKSEKDSRRYAIDNVVDQRSSYAFRGPLITIRIGFESVSMPRHEFGKLLSALDNAEKSGSEYPEDWKPFVGLVP